MKVGSKVQIPIGRSIEHPGGWCERPFLVVGIEANGARLILRDYAHPIEAERVGTFGETAAWCRLYPWN